MPCTSAACYNPPRVQSVRYGPRPADGQQTDGPSQPQTTERSAEAAALLP